MVATMSKVKQSGILKFIGGIVSNPTVAVTAGGKRGSRRPGWMIGDAVRQIVLRMICRR